MADPIGQSGTLPPINYLDMEKIKREHSYYSHSAPVTSALNMAPPLVSPSTMYSGPPPPYSYPSSAASSMVGGGGAGNGAGSGEYHSPATTLRSDTRRTSDEDKERPQPQPPRQSLPSIHEALHANGDQQNISISSLLSSTTAPPQQTSFTMQSPPTSMPRSYLDAPPKGPPDSFPPQNPTTSFPQQTLTTYGSYGSLDRSNRPMHSPRMATNYGTNRSPAMHSANNHSAIQSPRLNPSSSTYSRSAASSFQNRLPSTPACDPVPQATSSTSTPFGYNTYQPAYSYPPTSNGVASYRTPPMPQSAWRTSNADMDRAEEVRKATSNESTVARSAYGESVKRHLDIFDIETSLNEIAEGSGRALEFSRRFSLNAHHAVRSGPIPGSLPSVAECDDIIRQQGRVLDSASRIREVVLKEQQERAEKRSFDQQNFKAAIEADDDAPGYMDKLDGDGGFAGSDAKKRRGRAAPPGRCHSCNRAETPEWRRGPDGARTLCNACGLHYAKLTRKMTNGNKMAAGPSTLRPKESSPGSP